VSTNQLAVSKLERQADMYISTLRSFIHAMGGQLRIEAEFPDGVSCFAAIGAGTKLATNLFAFIQVETRLMVFRSAVFAKFKGYIASFL
jgi:hypothetical protein